MNGTQEPAVTLANAALQKAGFDPAFTIDAQFSDHKQYAGEFEGETLRKVLQKGMPPYMAMILIGPEPRVVVLKQGARDLI